MFRHLLHGGGGHGDQEGEAGLLQLRLECYGPRRNTYQPIQHLLRCLHGVGGNRFVKGTECNV